MNKIISLGLLIILLNYSTAVEAQTNSFSGWLVLSHIQKLSPKFNISFDAQLRSKDNLEGIRTIIIRPGINYNINKKLSMGIGYAYITTQTDKDSPLKPTLLENMVWEQALVTSHIKNILVFSRVRLEQRFIEQQSQDVFSQRLRLFNKFFIPLSKTNNINDGVYLALQDELLFNVQNKNDLNTHLFDQNRALVGLGHHFSNYLTSELGYQMIALKGKTENINRHILQLTLLTRLGK